MSQNSYYLSMVISQDEPRITSSAGKNTQITNLKVEVDVQTGGQFFAVLAANPNQPPDDETDESLSARLGNVSRLVEGKRIKGKLSPEELLAMRKMQGTVMGTGKTAHEAVISLLGELSELHLLTQT